MSEAFKSPVQKRRAESSTLTDHERAILATEMAAQDMTIQGRLSVLEENVLAVKKQVDSIKKTTKFSDVLTALVTNTESVLRDGGAQVMLMMFVGIITIGVCVYANIKTPSAPAKLCTEHVSARNRQITTRIIVTKTNGEVISYDDACATAVTTDVTVDSAHQPK